MAGGLCFFAVFDAFVEQILDLTVDRTEVILCPVGQLFPKGWREAQQDLLFIAGLVVSHFHPPF